LPESWAQMNHIPIDVLRQHEAKYGKVCRDVNTVDGYVSPAALYNRKDLLEKLVGKVKTFYAVINGTSVVSAPTAAPAQGGGRNLLQAVDNVRRTVYNKSPQVFNVPVQAYASKLTSVIGRVVHPLLKIAYPSLVDDDEQDVCDADDAYDDDVGQDADNAGQYDDAAQQGGYNGSGAAPSSPPATGPSGDYFDDGNPPQQPAYTGALPMDVSQGGVYKLRKPKSAVQFADGGDAYDMN